MHFGRDLVRSFLLGVWDGLSLSSHVERLFFMVEKGFGIVCVIKILFVSVEILFQYTCESEAWQEKQWELISTSSFTLITRVG